MNKAFVIALLTSTVLFIGCEKKLEPVQVGEMNEYKDPAYGFKIKYPKIWKSLGTTGKAVFCKSQEVANKFMDPSSGEEGAMVKTDVIPYAGKSAEELINAAKEDMKQIAELGADEQVTISGKTATKVPYTIKITSKISINGFQVFVPGDTAVYMLECLGYGDQYTAHASVFDAVLKSFELPVIMARKSDTWMASPNLETYTSNYFMMQYPENMNIVSVPKGDKDFVMEMRADRQDCSIHIDVFGAKALTVDKVWEQNKGKYKARAKGETTIDGNKAYWVDYSLMANVTSRAYFVVKNDKVIRATLNWYTQQKDIYFPVLEKIVNSLKLK